MSKTVFVTRGPTGSVAAGGSREFPSAWISQRAFWASSHGFDHDSQTLNGPRKNSSATVRGSRLLPSDPDVFRPTRKTLVQIAAG
jgi:hypothetical protein